MTDRLDELLFSIGEEQNGRVDFDSMYAALLKKQKEEEKKRSIRRLRLVRYGAMAACGVALVGIGAAVIGDMLQKAEVPMMTPMSDGYMEEAAEAGDTAGGAGNGAKLAMQTDDTGGIEIEIGTCADAESRLKAAGITAEPYEGDDAPREGYALMLDEGEAIWNAGSGVYKVTLNGDVAEQLKELCE